MQTLYVKKIKPIDRVEEISRTFDHESVVFHRVGLVNWKEYAYTPDVQFRIAHDGQRIYLNWQVDEKEIKAVCEKDLGEVWKDSCVELFIAFEGPSYYNIESNCIGKILVCTGVDRNNRIPVATENVAKICRWSSLGYTPVSNRSGQWELSLTLPKELFYLDAIDAFDRRTARGNFYKCGDNLQQPHFLTWNAIENEIPNFHLPEYFGRLIFE